MVFSNIQFLSKTNFSDSLFKNTIFENVSFAREFYFDKCSFDKTCHFAALNFKTENNNVIQNNISVLQKSVAHIDISLYNQLGKLYDEVSKKWINLKNIDFYNFNEKKYGHILVSRKELAAFLNLTKNNLAAMASRGVLRFSKNKKSYLLSDVQKFILKRTNKGKIAFSSNCVEALDIAIPLEKNETSQSSDSLLDKLQRMQKYRYSNIPIIENEKIIGILNLSALLRYIINGNEKVDFTSLCVGDLSNETKLVGNKTVLFVSKKANLKKIKDAFNTSSNSKRELEVVLITSNGKANGKLLGLITSNELASH